LQPERSGPPVGLATKPRSGTVLGCLRTRWSSDLYGVDVDGNRWRLKRDSILLHGDVSLASQHPKKSQEMSRRGMFSVQRPPRIFISVKLIFDDQERSGGGETHNTASLGRERLLTSWKLHGLAAHVPARRSAPSEERALPCPPQTRSSQSNSGRNP